MTLHSPFCLLLDNLAVSAQGFRRGANHVRKKMWWKDMKMRIIIIVGIIILLCVIISECGREKDRAVFAALLTHIASLLRTSPDCRQEFKVNYGQVLWSLPSSEPLILLPSYAVICTSRRAVRSVPCLYTPNEM